MEFRIRERESDEDVEWIAEWPFPPRSHFIQSRAYDVLLREIDRYVRGEVPGRSFLISGHRGAGKTSLVRQATEDLNRAILEAALQRAGRARLPGASRLLERTLGLQRPLLVRLHGPSLLGPVKKGADQSKEPAVKVAENAPAAKKDDQAAPIAPAAGAPIATASKQEADASADSTTFALEQITIALYRALTMEFGRSFTNHARDKLTGRDRSGGSDYLELAGQFTLELDNAPRAAVLRSYYAQLDRVESGVLWPLEIGNVLLLPGTNDQGIREIIALATAGQAFEVCSGDITDKQTRKGIQSRDETAETKVEAGLKDVANKVLGLGAGVLVGLGAVPSLGPAGGAAAGVATGLLSTLTLGWTSKRSRKDERVLDYTFIRRRDRATLERDLPLVIQRVREAGLAPIFVVDELDKLKDPKKSIAELINSLKHLTTDYGFFCFLTDRDYFDYVTRKVTQEAFPVEHSFFSHRMFILHQPKPLLEYLGRITQVDAGTGSGAPTTSPAPGDAIEEAAARSSFGLLVLHRSKLNLIEILRKIAEECDSFGRVRPSSGKLRADHGYRFEASIQLVIGLLLRRPAMRERVENESRFMQRAIDALYMLSRAWENEELTVRLDRVAIVKCLLERSGRVEVADPAPKAEANTHNAEAAKKTRARRKGPAKTTVPTDPAEEARKAEADLLQTGMSLRDLELVDEAVAMLADLLSDVNRLKTWIAAELEPGPEQAALISIFPPGNLVECVDPQLRLYKFLSDVYGQDLQTRAALQAAHAIAIQQGAGDVVGGLAAADAGIAVSGAETDAAASALRAPSDAAAATGPVVPALPEPISKEVRRALAFVDNLELALTAAGASIPELVGLQIFPPIDPAEFERAAGRLREAVRVDRPYEGLSKDLPLLRSIVSFVKDNGAALTELARLVLSVSGSAGARTLWASEAVAAVARYIDVRSVFAATMATFRPWRRIVGLPFSFEEIEVVPTEDPESLLKWRDQFLRWRELPPGPRFDPIVFRQVWSAAADAVHAHLDKGAPILDPLRYDYLMGAAADAPPGNVLRHDLRQVTAAEWSGLCLVGFPAAEGRFWALDRQGPFWAFIAGLRALGFNRRILELAMGLPHYSGEDDRLELCERLVNSASRSSTAGYVLVMRDDGISVADTVDYLRHNLAQKIVVPSLALPEQGLSDYKEALDWLAENGAVTRLIYEEGD